MHLLYHPQITNIAFTTRLDWNGRKEDDPPPVILVPIIQRSNERTPWKLGPQLRLDSGDYAGHYSSYDIHLSVHWAVTSQSQSVTSTVERSERSKGMPGSQTRAVAKLGLSLKCGES